MVNLKRMLTKLAVGLKTVTDDQAGIKTYYLTKTVSITGGQNFTIDVSGDITSGTIVGVDTKIGIYALPYFSVSGGTATFLYRITNDKKLEYYNTAASWPTTIYLTIRVKE